MDIVTIEMPEYQQVLKTPAQPVHFPLSPDDQQLIMIMKDKLDELGGVGLAAPQINYHRQIIAIYIPEAAARCREQGTPYPMHIMINPRYQPAANAQVHADFEACYSVTSKAGKVPRYDQIELDYDDEQGNHHQQLERGFYARVLQHEIDHINGILIVDRLTEDCVQGTPEEMRALRRAELSAFDQAHARENELQSKG